MNNADAQLSASSKTKSLDHSRFSILAVDDEPANLNLLKRTFHRDYELLFAEDGVRGLEVMEKHHVDLIITDQRMPRMTGIEMLSRSREILPDAVRIVLTAYTDVNYIIEAINLGHVYRYIVKPWAPDELRTTIEQGLDYYHLQKLNAHLVEELKQSLRELQEAQSELIVRERLSAVGQIASTIIHDIKLPIANIRTSAEILANSNINDDLRREFSTLIVKEVDRLVGMTREILEFTRGETKLELSEFPLDDLLEDVLGKIELDFAKIGIKITRNWNNLPKVTGDFNRLWRVLSNLVMNSRDAMKNGGEILVDVDVITAEPLNEKLIRIKVADTGTGIPPEILPRIFDPFVTHGKSNGTGLGMSIAKRIVEAHKGNITAENRPEGGALITIKLPIVSNYA